MRLLVDIPPERAIAMLSGIREFKNLPGKDLQTVAECCRWQHYIAGENIVRYQDHTDNTFFITQGTIRVTYYSASGQEVILCDLPAGEMFGELTAIDGHVRSALVVARTDSIVASMTAPAFLNLIHSNQQICLAILKRLTGQVRRLTERVFDFSTLAVRNRIHTELLRLAEKQATSPNMAIISPAPTHADIANLVSTHREAVTRELNELARSKLIVRKGNDLHILDMDKLKRMIADIRGSS